MRNGAKAVRVGPVSVLSLVVFVCLAVMAVLSVATAQASWAEVGSQARFADATYENDAEAARMLADVDASLEASRQAGLDADQAAARLASVLPDGADVSGARVDVSFASESGRTLRVVLRIDDGLRYEIERWSTGVDRDEDPSPGALWAG